MAVLRSIALLSLAASALARTDLEGCTYSDSVVVPSSHAPYNTRIWYVPDTGEICKVLDCGGGRAPPKTTVPGCPLYSGSETYSPSFMDTSTTGGDVSATPASAAPAASASGSLAHASSAHVSATPTSMPREEGKPPSSPARQTTKSRAAGPSPSGAAASTGAQGDGEAEPPSSSTPISAATATRAVLGSALLAGVAAAAMSLL